MLDKILSFNFTSLALISSDYRQNFRSSLAYSSTREGHVLDNTIEIGTSSMKHFLDNFLPFYSAQSGETTPPDRVKYPVSELNYDPESQSLSIIMENGVQRTFHFPDTLPSPKESHGGGTINNVIDQRRLEMTKLSEPLLPEQQLDIIGEQVGEKALQFQKNMEALKITLRVIPGSSRMSLIIKSKDVEVNIHTKTAIVTQGYKVPNSAEKAGIISEKTQFPINLIVNNMRQDILKNLQSFAQIIKKKKENHGFCLDWRIGSNQLKIIKSLREILAYIEQDPNDDQKKLTKSYQKLMSSTVSLSVNELLEETVTDGEHDVKLIQDPALIKRCAEKILEKYLSILNYVNHFFINSSEAETLFSREELQYIPCDDRRASSFADLLIRYYGVKLAIVTDGERGASLGGRIHQENTPRGYTVSSFPTMNNYDHIKSTYRKYNEMGAAIPISEDGNTTGCGDSVAAAMEFTFRYKGYENWPDTKRLQFAQYVAAMVYCLDDSNLLQVPQDCVNSLVSHFERSIPSPEMGFIR